MDAAQQRTNAGAEKRKKLPTAKKPKKKKKGANPSTPEKPPPGKAKRIRVYPTKEESEMLQRWIGTARWTYNECLRAVQNENVPRNKKALRARALNEEAIVKMNKTWLRNTPYDVRDGGMDDMLKAYASGFARKKNDHKAFKLSFRSRKLAPQESIVINYKHWKRKRGGLCLHQESAIG